MKWIVFQKNTSYQIDSYRDGKSKQTNDHRINKVAVEPPLLRKPQAQDSFTGRIL